MRIRELQSKLKFLKKILKDFLDKFDLEVAHKLRLEVLKSDFVILNIKYVLVHCREA